MNREQPNNCEITFSKGSCGIDKCYMTTEEIANFPEVNPHPVLSVSSNGTLLFANSAARTLVKPGIPGEKCRVMDEATLKLITECLKNSRVKSFEREIDDKTFFFEAVPVNKKDCVMIYGSDITMQKKAVDELLLTKIFVESASDDIMLMDSGGRFRYVNEAAARGLGYTREELLSMSLPDVEPDLPFDMWSERWEEIRKSASIFVESRFRRRNGTLFPVEAIINFINYRDQEFAICIARDITERKKIEEEKALAAEVFRNSTEGIMITDLKGVIVDVNRAFTEITGCSKDEMIGGNPESMASTDRHDQDFFKDMWREVREKGTWNGEMWGQRKNGEVFPIWLAINPVLNSEGARTHFVGMFSDLSKRKETEEKLYHLSHYDLLTGLPNKYLFKERVEQLINYARAGNDRMALLFIDLDGFKNANDAYGHSFGDMLLKRVSDRLRLVLSDIDSIARQGGDEFTVLLPEIKDERDAAFAAERIISSLSEPFTFEDDEVFTTASIGITIFPDDGAGFDALMMNVDAAMYQAKKKGGNGFQFFRGDMNSKTRERLLLETYLRRALERDQFSLHYQPKVNLSTRKIVGMEALLRWSHTELGNIPPGKFISIAESTGLIIPIGRWVLETACSQASKWIADGLEELIISVNVSTRQFLNENFIPELITILDATGLPPANLEIELTESTIMMNPDELQRTLGVVKDMGISLSIDDFGTGYSSLSRLKRLPIDTLKVDQSFIFDLADDPDSQAITRSIIALGQTLKLKIVAEGVETTRQLDFLSATACDEIQGFLFSRPLTAENFEDLVRNGREPYIIPVSAKKY